MFSAFIHQIIQHFNQPTLQPIQKLSYEINLKSLQPSTMHHLLLLEESLHQRNYTINQLNDLLYTYARLIELFDEQKDFYSLKQYFLEKMQFLLSRPESIKLMMDNPSDSKIQQEDLSRVTYQSEEPQQYQSPNIRYSIEKKKIQRAVQTKIFIEVEEQKVEQEKDIKDLLKEFEQTSKEYEEWIQIQLQDQGDQIKQKIQQRKKSRKKRANSISEQQFFAKFIPIQELPETSPFQDNTATKQVTFQDDSQPKSQASVKSQKNERIINEIEESVSFMRKSIQRMSSRRSQMHRKGAISQGILKNN